MVQQAREYSMTTEVTGKGRFLIHDRDSKFSGPFDEVFAVDGVKVILTPVRAPNANAHAERWVRTVREECLDWMLIYGRRHLIQILRIYIEHYNRERPHRSRGLNPPLDLAESKDRPEAKAWSIGRKDRLGGLLHEYFVEDAAA
jgi:transposase InsO family protein